MGGGTIIDSHVHLKHGDAGRTEYSPEVIVRTMDSVGIDLSVVFAMSTTTERSIEMASEAVRKFPERLVPYAYALPRYDRTVLEELRYAIEGLGFKGIKVHAGECTLAEYVLDPVLELAGELGVPCLVDCLGRIEDSERMAESFLYVPTGVPPVAKPITESGFCLICLAIIFAASLLILS